jgi:[ribosomal protein S18]-alanine N-acetyltransferase
MIPFLPVARVYAQDLGPGDADALMEVHAAAFSRPWAAHDFAALVAERNVTAVGVRRQSAFGFARLVGFVVLRTAADEAEVLTIAVRPGQRGRGIGRQLMEEALRRLYRDRIASCFLEVDGDNLPAIALYRALGFKQVGERKGYYDRPSGPAGAALVMRLRLG